MFRKILGFWVLVLMLMSAGSVYALDHTVDDYDGAEGSNMTSSRWSGEWGGDAYQTGSTVTVPSPVLGDMGASYWLNWGNVDVSGEGTGCGLQNIGGVDVSTYNALSFWIWSRDAAEQMTIELVDTNADTARLALTDYLTTGASTWQEVSIPLVDFLRDDVTMDLNDLDKINFLADYDAGTTVDGNVYFDDVKLTIQSNAPGDSKVYSGGDNGLTNVADLAGDTILWWDQASSSITSNVVSATVQDGYGISWVAQPADANGSANSTAYFAYQILNKSNDADTIVFSTAQVSGESWEANVYWDRNKNGSYDAGIDTDTWSSVGAIAGTTYYFLVGVDIPVSAVDGAKSTITVTARDNNGSGANDSWPTASNDDTITDTFLLTVQGTNLSLVKSSSTATGQPGDNITYTLTYGNTGSIAATSVTLVDNVPTNTTLVNSVTSPNGEAIEYWYSSQWNGSYNAAATKVKWTRATLAGSTTGQAVAMTVTIK